MVVRSPGLVAVCLLLRGGLPKASPAQRIHMVTFTTEMYEGHFADSLAAKEAYAKHWGYGWEVFTEDTLSCSDFRPQRWRGDFRYCKLEALKVMWKRIVDLRKQTRGKRDYIFWHDVDTHIMRPETPLEAFLEAAGHAPVVFTDNALSLNNGVFFLEVSKQGSGFFKSWRSGCRTGEWPWADNGCMYEVLLSLLGGERYGGRCREYREPEFRQQKPEPPTGPQLMKCFNEEMDALGMGCCGKVCLPDGQGRLLQPPSLPRAGKVQGVRGRGPGDHPAALLRGWHVHGAHEELQLRAGVARAGPRVRRQSGREGGAVSGTGGAATVSVIVMIMEGSMMTVIQ